jgi:hypothetical protein
LYEFERNEQTNDARNERLFSYNLLGRSILSDRVIY